MVLLRAADPRRGRRRRSGSSSQPPAFDLDLDAIAAAITPRTRAVIVNSPHNPSGRSIRSSDAAQPRGRRSTRRRRATAAPIYLVSDEPYNRIVFDGREFHSPAEVYPHTITSYSYGKPLLAPGMRIGYLDGPADDAGPRALRERIMPRPARGRIPVPERAAPARDRGPRAAVDRRRRARASARPAGPALRATGLRDDDARGHVLRHGAHADRRRRRVLRAPRRQRRARPAGHGRRGARLVPHLADRERRDGRPGLPASSGRCRSGATDGYATPHGLGRSRCLRAGSLVDAELLRLHLVEAALHVVDRLVEALAGRGRGSVQIVKGDVVRIAMFVVRLATSAVQAHSRGPPVAWVDPRP